MATKAGERQLRTGESLVRFRRSCARPRAQARRSSQAFAPVELRRDDEADVGRARPNAWRVAIALTRACCMTCAPEASGGNLGFSLGTVQGVA